MDERGSVTAAEGVNEKLTQLYTNAEDQIYDIGQARDRHTRRTRCRKALEICNEAFVVGADTVNDDFPVAFWQIQAICYRHLREYDNSIRVHRSILENLQQAKRPDQAEILKWRYNLSKELLTTYDIDKSRVAELDDAIVLLCTNVDCGPNAKFFTRSLVSLSLGLVKQSRVPGTDERRRLDLMHDAESCSLQAINLLQSRMETGPKRGDAELLLEARHNLAMLYHRLTKFSEAETLFLKNQATLRALTDKIPGYNIYAGVAERYLAFYYQKSLQDDSVPSDPPSKSGKANHGNESTPTTVQSGHHVKQEENLPLLVLPQHQKPTESTSVVSRSSSVKSDGNRSRSKSPHPRKSEDGRRHSMNVGMTRSPTVKPSNEKLPRNTTPVESQLQLPVPIAVPATSDVQIDRPSSRSKQLEIPQGSSTRARSSSLSRQLAVPHEPTTRPRSSSISSLWTTRAGAKASNDVDRDMPARDRRTTPAAASNVGMSSNAKARSPKREIATKPQPDNGEAALTEVLGDTLKGQVSTREKTKTAPIISSSNVPDRTLPPPKLQAKPVNSSSHGQARSTQADRGRMTSTETSTARPRSVDRRHGNAALSKQEDSKVKMPNGKEMQLQLPVPVAFPATSVVQTDRRHGDAALSKQKDSKLRPPSQEELQRQLPVPVNSRTPSVVQADGRRGDAALSSPAAFRATSAVQADGRHGDTALSNPVAFTATSAVQADGRLGDAAPSKQIDSRLTIPNQEELLRARIAQHDEVIGELLSSNDEAVSWAKLWFLRLRRWTHADLLKYHDNTRQQEVRVRVAILDSGYNPRRSDVLKVRKQFKGFRDFVNTANTVACDVDPEEHGTNCSSLLARVAPAAHIYVANVIEKSAKGRLQPSWIALRDALEWALTEDVDIISVSCGLHKLVDELSRKLDMVKACRKLVVVAIPNTKPEGYDYDNFPSFDHSVLSINARRLDWTAAVQPWSKQESSILFPGENVPILGNDDKQIPGTQLLTGTSFATPLAAGTMALIFDLLLRVDPIRGKSSTLYGLLLQPRHAATVLRGMSERVQQNVKSFNVMPWKLLGEREPLEVPKAYADEVPEVTEKQVFTASLIKTILEIESLQQLNS
ncbi:hypothetical protein AMS68_002631 [Peltaster fructicola]|uniref:Peptidase S8/S53 domain-containing protein n=1 Tax=Peltaster fructicola TaxID=286661 RepID=A0A6H0XQV7_9PEZI|nr:hypothetical protein AMS68_002631 [Peltaster fructicola]